MCKFLVIEDRRIGEIATSSYPQEEFDFSTLDADVIRDLREAWTLTTSSEEGPQNDANARPTVPTVRQHHD